MSTTYLTTSPYDTSKKSSNVKLSYSESVIFNLAFNDSVSNCVLEYVLPVSLTNLGVNFLCKSIAVVLYPTPYVLLL